MKLSARDHAILSYAEHNGEIQAGDPVFFDAAPFPVERRDLLRLQKDRLLLKQVERAFQAETWEITSTGLDAISDYHLDEVA